LQKAVKEENIDAVWDLLDPDTQEDAEEQAKKAQELYASGDALLRKDLEKRHEFKAGDFANLNGRNYVRSKLFWEEIEDLPASRIRGVSVDGDKAEVAYTEPDGKDETLELTRVDGKWKVVVDVPTAAGKM
jgi:hypothetical protein